MWNWLLHRKCKNISVCTKCNFAFGAYNTHELTSNLCIDLCPKCREAALNLRNRQEGVSTWAIRHIDTLEPLLMAARREALSGLHLPFISYRPGPFWPVTPDDLQIKRKEKYGTSQN